MIRYDSMICYNSLKLYESRYFNDMKNDMKWSDSIWYEMIWNDSDMIKIWDDDTRSTDISFIELHSVSMFSLLFTLRPYLMHVCAASKK